MKKALCEFDFRDLVEKRRRENEAKILNEYLHRFAKMDEYNSDDLVLERERVRNYGTGILTLRYKGDLVFRRFPMDMEGLAYRYESPIFNNVTE